MSLPRFKPGSLCVIVHHPADDPLPDWLSQQMTGRVVTLREAHYGHDEWWWEFEDPLIVHCLVPARTSVGTLMGCGSHEVCISERTLMLIKGPDIETEESHLDELDQRIAEAHG